MDNSTLPEPLVDYMQGSTIALSLAEAGNDEPLVLVNKRFERLTGYTQSEIAGRNCRFLQGNADNADARAQIHRFLESDRQQTVRTPIVNFRKDGVPFVNLLFMSKLRWRGDVARYIFASQFDVSRSQADLLREYDKALGETLTVLSPALAESGVILEGSLNSIANTATMIAQAKLMLSDIDANRAG